MVQCCKVMLKHSFYEGVTQIFAMLVLDQQPTGETVITSCLKLIFAYIHSYTWSHSDYIIAVASSAVLLLAKYGITR